MSPSFEFPQLFVSIIQTTFASQIDTLGVGKGQVVHPSNFHRGDFLPDE